MHLKCQWHNHYNGIACVHCTSWSASTISSWCARICAQKKKTTRMSKTITIAIWYRNYIELEHFQPRICFIFMTIFRCSRRRRRRHEWHWLLRFRFFTVHLLAQSGIHRSRSPFYYTVDCLICWCWCPDIVVGHAIATVIATATATIAAAAILHKSHCNRNAMFFYKTKKLLQLLHNFYAYIRCFSSNKFAYTRVRSLSLSSSLSLFRSLPFLSLLPTSYFMHYFKFIIIVIVKVFEL